MAKPFTMITALLLLIVAAAHVYGLIAGISIVAGGHGVPIWVSWPGAIVARASFGDDLSGSPQIAVTVWSRRDSANTAGRAPMTELDQLRRRVAFGLAIASL